MTEEDRFGDQLDAVRVQQAQLERRRELARQMIASGMKGNTGSGYQGGRVFIVGNPLGNIASGIAGSLMNRNADTEATDLAASQAKAQNDWQEQFNAAADPAEQQRLLATARNKGLRYNLEQQFAEQEAKRIEAGEQAAANRVETAAEKDANRAFLAAQKDLDRQNRLDARATPTVHITNGGGRSGGIKAPSGYRYNEDGTALEPIPGGPHDPAGKADKPLTENQGNAVLYGARAGEAHKVLDTVGTDYSTIKADMAHATSNTPGVGSMVNAGLSAKEQQVVQAQRDFVNAVMRRESGAAIAPSEFANARKQYFPQPGDSAEVLAQKKANRELVIKGLAEVSGPTGKKAIEAITPKAAPKADTLTPAEQAELDQLRAKHGRK